MYIYIHTCIYRYMNMYIHIYTTLVAGVAVDVPSATAHVCLNDGTIVQVLYIYIYIYIYIYAYIYIYICIYIYIYIYIYLYMFICICSYIYPYIYTSYM